MNDYKALQYFFKKYQSNTQIATLDTELSLLHNEKNLTKIINVYDTSIPIIEKEIWQKNITDSTLKLYQSLFHELESLYQSAPSDADDRYGFIITIPVADRPQHLQDCLHSIMCLCEKYMYGGQHNGVYKKIRVLIADDSQFSENKKRHFEIAQNFTTKGLETIYFSQEQQKQTLSTLNHLDIDSITGSVDSAQFHHKGASITRNISYLKLQQLQQKYKHEKNLFYFIDSDQEFQVIIKTPNGNKELYAVNYFYYLNRIFSTQNINVLTGKVVGDPPVSPAVMAGTFLQDVIHFLQQASMLDIEVPCEFHKKDTHLADDASYHDMAELFGFKKKSKPYNYPCPLSHVHKNIDCFEYFTNQINHFFDGEHPTRKSYYQHEDILNSVKPARTIYTGNYIFKPENLKYFIPFAPLKLRMAGPVLGRILKSELSDTFVSANLPMLHKRTVDASGESEFRPGVEHTKNKVDLSGEFHRQFFGDVMLFSIIELCELGYPEINISLGTIENTVQNTINKMQHKYMQTQKDISKKTTEMKKLLNSTSIVDFIAQAPPKTGVDLMRFINSIELNFKNNAKNYTDIHSETNTLEYTKKISYAIYIYKSKRLIWENALSDSKVNS